MGTTLNEKYEEAVRLINAGGLKDAFDAPPLINIQRERVQWQMAQMEAMQKTLKPAHRNNGSKVWLGVISFLGLLYGSHVFVILSGGNQQFGTPWYSPQSIFGQSGWKRWTTRRDG